MRALLIEDNPGDALQIQYALEDADEPIDLVRASRLSLGLELLSHQKFDIILLDLTLPDCQGLKSLVKIRETSQTPVVVFSGFNPGAYATEALRLGAKGFLVKGQTRKEELFSVLQKAVAAPPDPACTAASES